MPRTEENPMSALGRDLQRGVDPDVLADIGYEVPDHMLSEDRPGNDPERTWRLTAEEKLLGQKAIEWLHQQYPDLDSRKK